MPYFGNLGVRTSGKVLQQPVDDVLLPVDRRRGLILDRKQITITQFAQRHAALRGINFAKITLKVPQLALGDGLVGGFEGSPFLLALVFYECIVHAVG